MEISDKISFGVIVIGVEGLFMFYMVFRLLDEIFN